jgi:hypothetical protein
MAGGVFISQIEKINSVETWEEARPLLLEALREISDHLPQVTIVATKGEPEFEIKADPGKVLVLNTDAASIAAGKGVAFVKETGPGLKTGWREIDLV